MNELGESILKAMIESNITTENEKDLTQKISEEYVKLFGSSEYKDKITLYPGTEEGLKILQQFNLSLGVLSNGSMQALERDLGYLFPYFQFTICQAKKPDCSIYLQNLSKINLKPNVNKLEMKKIVTKFQNIFLGNCLYWRCCF